MNFSAPIGFLISVAVLYFAVSYGIPSSHIFFNPHAAVIVVGGTLAASLICFPIKHFVTLIRIYIRTMLGRTEQATHDTINEIVSLSQALNDGASLESMDIRVTNPFLQESLNLIKDGGLNDEELTEVLEKRVELQNERYRREGNTYKIIGKFPPAFGLVGTTLGMISLLQSLGTPNAFERIGPSMSIALVATFYGLILANVVIIPVAENLIQSSETDLIRRRIVIDGVRLLMERKHPLLVEEHLKSYLSPSERNKMKKSAA
ncbi:MAG: MotA/TolQ/ExbB proton channel family protein [Bdellovibrionales bacterium]|nr:MotA/TolQ/ExbB proton channel family protein [Bdellovibrionales bacterium]